MVRRRRRVTRLLLAIAADSLVRQGARIGDTITLCTRILLTAQDLYHTEIGHGGSNGVGSTRNDGWKKTWLKCRVALVKVRWAFYIRSGKMNPNARETVMLL